MEPDLSAEGRELAKAAALAAAANAKAGAAERTEAGEKA